MADHYHAGRLFLAGDAAHSHSPAGAQGMKTPASRTRSTCLGWKLAFASRYGDGVALLDSYEQERRPMARQVLTMTHLIFFAEASTNRCTRSSAAPSHATATAVTSNLHVSPRRIACSPTVWTDVRRNSRSAGGWWPVGAMAPGAPAAPR
jgi:2-polyprenyl-6-methoxyphenol hydroxylase-like FAD-dependent oxidoreductase